MWQKQAVLPVPCSVPGPGMDAAGWEADSSFTDRRSSIYNPDTRYKDNPVQLHKNLNETQKNGVTQALNIRYALDTESDTKKQKREV